MVSSPGIVIAGIPLDRDLYREGIVFFRITSVNYIATGIIKGMLNGSGICRTLQKTTCLSVPTITTVVSTMCYFVILGIHCTAMTVKAAPVETVDARDETSEQLNCDTDSYDRCMVVSRTNAAFTES